MVLETELLGGEGEEKEVRKLVSETLSSQAALPEGWWFALPQRFGDH